MIDVPNIVNNLVSGAATEALSGLQGRILNERFESGAWTPALAGASGGATITDNGSRYVRVGRIVTLTLCCNIVPGTGDAVIEVNGLPFSAKALSGSAASYTGSLARIRPGDPQSDVYSFACASIGPGNFDRITFKTLFANNSAEFSMLSSEGTGDFSASITYEADISLPGEVTHLNN